MTTEEKMIVVRQFINYLKKTVKGVKSSYYKKEYHRLEKERMFVEVNSLECPYFEMYEALCGRGYISIEIRDLLDQLPDRQKTVIEMNVIENYTEREIAKYLNISQPGVNQAKAKGFKSLRKLLEENNE